MLESIEGDHVMTGPVVPPGGSTPFTHEIFAELTGGDGTFRFLNSSYAQPVIDIEWIMD